MDDHTQSGSLDIQKSECDLRRSCNQKGNRPDTMQGQVREMDRPSGRDQLCRYDRYLVKYVFEPGLLNWFWVH